MLNRPWLPVSTLLQSLQMSAALRAMAGLKLCRSDGRGGRNVSVTQCVVSWETHRDRLLSREEWRPEVTILGSVPRSLGQFQGQELGGEAVNGLSRCRCVLWLHYWLWLCFRYKCLFLWSWPLHQPCCSEMSLWISTTAANWCHFGIADRSSGKAAGAARPFLQAALGERWQGLCLLLFVLPRKTFSPAGQ